MRPKGVGEIRHVIPDIKARRDGFPSFDVVSKTRVGSTIQRLRKISFDRAKPNNHIRAWANILRWLARVLVSQSFDPKVRKLLFDGFSDRINGLQKWTAWRTFLRFECFAIRALAGRDVIILRNRNQAG